MVVPWHRPSGREIHRAEARCHPLSFRLLAGPMNRNKSMKLSYIIVTHNRRDALLRTLRILRQTTPLAKRDWETWVVDNGSTDGTAEAVRAAFPQVRLISRAENEGVWARSYAFEPASGQYVILLDDDSYPTGDAVIRSMEYLDANPACGAVVGRVHPAGWIAGSVRVSGGDAQRGGLHSQVGDRRYRIVSP